MKKFYTIETTETEVDGILRKDGILITPIPKEMEKEIYLIDSDYFEYNGKIKVHQSLKDEIEKLPKDEEDYNCFAGMIIFGSTAEEDLCLEKYLHHVLDDGTIILLIDDESDEGKQFYKTARDGAFFCYY